MDENGNKLWSKIYPDFKSFDYIAVDRGDRIYLSVNNGKLVTLDKQGGIDWQRKSHQKRIERLSLAVDGVLVSGENANGFAIKHYTSDGKLRKRYSVGLKGITLFNYKFTKKGDLLAVGNQSLLPANFEGFCDAGEDKNAALLLKGTSKNTLLISQKHI